MKILLIAGARPNFMKIAPIVRALQNGNVKGIEWKIVHTGQHYDDGMSETFFRDLGIPAPDLFLNAGSGSHAVQTGRIMTAFEDICDSEKPDWVVVVGDVNSTLACAIGTCGTFHWIIGSSFLPTNCFSICKYPVPIYRFPVRRLRRLRRFRRLHGFI